MAFAIYTIPHDDTKHVGSAKRNTAGGVAGLDSNTKIDTSQLYTNIPNGVAQLDSKVKISSDKLYLNTANGIPQLDSNGKIPADKLYLNTANGIPQLDSNGKIPVSLHPNPLEFPVTHPVFIPDLRSSRRLIGVKIYWDNTGNSIVWANDTETNTTNTLPTKVKEINLQYPPDTSLKIYFELKSSGVSYYSHGQIYKNGLPVGTEQITNSTSYTGFTQTISEWTKEDKLQLYIWAASGATAYAQNLRILGTYGLYETWNIM